MTVLRDGELVLYGFVGDNFWGEGFTASEVLDALAEVGRETDITVRINSGGGYATDGIAIFNALSAHKGKVTVEVDAIAASAASIIAMAGETIRMRAGSLMMIHDPSGWTSGTADAHERTRKALDKLAEQMAGIYADQAGKPAAEARADMKSELWLTADEAVEAGYADEADSSAAKAMAAFDYRRYAHAPEALTALAQTQNWTLGGPGGRPGSTALTPAAPEKDPPMTEKTPAVTAAEIEKASAEAAAKAVAADREKRSKVLALDSAKGREALAEHLYATAMTIEEIDAALAKAPKAPEPTADEKKRAEAEAYAKDRAAASAGLGAPEKPGGDKPRASLKAGDVYATRRKALAGA